MKAIGLFLFAILLCCSSLNAQTADDKKDLSPSMDQEGKWGYVDGTGAPEYDYAYPFLNGFALVMVNSRYGYINDTGSYVVRPRFEDAFPINKEGQTLVQQNHRLFIFDIKDESMDPLFEFDIKDKSTFPDL